MAPERTAQARYHYSFNNDAEAAAFLRDVCWGQGARTGNAVQTAVTPTVAGPAWVVLMGEHMYGGYAVREVTWVD